MRITRKMNLGVYGLQYETLDIESSEHETAKECFDEIREVRVLVHTGLMQKKLELLAELKSKQSLTPQEQELMDKISRTNSLSPF